MKQRVVWLSMLLAGAALAAEAPAARPAIDVPQAVGVAPFDGNVAASRERALLDAKRNAIESALGVALRSQTEVQKFRLVKDTIQVDTQQGFVFDDQVVKEQPNEQDHTYTVVIRCKVGTDPLVTQVADQFPKLYEQMERPRVVLLCDEKQADGSPGNALGTALTAGLKARGIDVLDRTQLAALADRDKVAQAQTGNPEAVAWVAAQAAAHLNAELLLNGTLTNRPGACEAALTLFNSWDARVMSAASARGASPEEVVRNLLPGPDKPGDLVAQLLARWLAEPTLITLNVAKPSFSQLRQLANDLQACAQPGTVDMTKPVESSKLPPVMDVTRQSFNPALAVLRLRTPYHRSAAIDQVSELMDRLGYEVKSVDGLRIDVARK